MRKINKKSKKWSWEDYSLKLKNKKLIEKSALVKVLKDGKRDFEGAKTKKGQAFGPVSAGTYSSAQGGSQGGTGGYGNSSYGFSAYGESINRLGEKIGLFVDGINDANGDIASSLLEAYSTLFNQSNGAKVILLGFQPSFVDNINFNIEELVNNINNFKGDILNIFLGPKSGFESLDIITDWYRDLGISEKAIKKMKYVEKTASVCGYEPIEANNEIYDDKTDYELDYQKINTLHEFKKLLSKWDRSGISGCADLYMLGEIIYIMKLLDLPYEIQEDSVYIIS